MAKKTKKPEQEIKKTMLRKWGIFFGTIFITAVAAATAGAYKINTLPESEFVQYFTAGPFALNTVQTFKEAQAVVSERSGEFLNTPLTFTSSRGSLTTTLKTTGVSIDTSAALAQLEAFMKGNAVQKSMVYLFGKNLELPLFVDEITLKNAFLDTNIEQGKKDASFEWNKGVVTVAAEQIGYGIDTTTLRADLKKMWERTGKTSDMELPLLTSEPAISVAKLQPLLVEAQAASTINFILTDDYGNEYPMPLSEHMNWLIPGSSNSFGIQQEAFITTVQAELSPALEEDPASVIITQNEAGAYTFEGSARFGQKIDTLALLDTVETTLQTALTVPETVTTLSIPVTRVMPEVTVPESLQTLGVKELVGVGYSDFSGSPSGRVHNINEGINQFNGVLIAQGAEFSFMEHLSPVDAEHGFLPELVIKGDETIPEYGGGMCQVSSTMFRAALYSGLPITARTNHSYAVSYYARPFGYGLDATVYDPAPDLKFLNDTPGALLVQSYVDGNSAYYVFYGTNDGRRVTMQGPSVYGYMSIPPDVVTYTDELAPGERRLKDHGHQGFQVDWIRTIIRMDGTETSETIHSYYEARPEKWEEGST